MKRTLYIVAVVFFAAVAIFSSYKLWQYYSEEKQVKDAFDDLSQQVIKPKDTVKPPPAPPDNSDPVASPSESADPPEPVEWTVYDQYGALFEKNSDMIGWIRIEDTVIDYPVMFTPDDPEYYLNLSFEKAYSSSGVPFVGVNCTIDPQSDNVIIHGHNMKSGTIFGSLRKYSKKDYWEEHPVIQFDTLTGFGQYEIIAVFTASPYSFKYYEFINAADEADFDKFIKKVKSLSYYDTGLTATYGDKLLTLSTCEYSAEYNRLVVVARKCG